MKVVINTYYGGFDLSHEAFLRLRELKEPIALEEPDIGEYWSDESGPREAGIFPLSFCEDIPRDSPNLIQVIEEMKERANTQFSELKIVEIPDDVE